LAKEEKRFSEKGWLLNHDAGKFLLTQCHAVPVDLHVPATAEWPLADNPEPGTRAHPDIQQFTRKILVGKAINGTGSTDIEVGSCSDPGKGHE
jgi:hypothetical protein